MTAPLKFQRYVPAVCVPESCKHLSGQSLLPPEYSLWSPGSWRDSANPLLSYVRYNEHPKQREVVRLSSC